MKEKGGEVCINRFSVNPSSLTHCDAVGGAGPAPRQMPRPSNADAEGKPVPAAWRAKIFYTHPPSAKAPRRITIRISIHAPIRGRLDLLTAWPSLTKFQSTPPYGGDFQTGQLEFLKFFHLFPRKAVSRFSNSRFQMLVLSVRFPLALAGLWKLPNCRSV